MHNVATAPMYVLESGQVRVLRMQPCSDGVLARVGKGSHVGELSALLETARSATVQVVTEAVVATALIDGR